MIYFWKNFGKFEKYLVTIHNFAGKAPPGRKYMCSAAYLEGLGQNATAYEVMTKGKYFPLPKKIEVAIESSNNPDLLFLFISKMRDHHDDEIKFLKDQVNKLNHENERLEEELAAKSENVSDSADIDANDTDA